MTQTEIFQCYFLVGCAAYWYYFVGKSFHYFVKKRIRKPWWLESFLIIAWPVVIIFEMAEQDALDDVDKIYDSIDQINTKK